MSWGASCAARPADQAGDREVLWSKRITWDRSIPARRAISSVVGCHT